MYDVVYLILNIFNCSLINPIYCFTPLLFQSQCRGISHDLSLWNNFYKTYIKITNFIIYYFAILFILLIEKFRNNHDLFNKVCTNKSAQKILGLNCTLIFLKFQMQWKLTLIYNFWCKKKTNWKFVKLHLLNFSPFFLRKEEIMKEKFNFNPIYIIVYDK